MRDNLAERLLATVMHWSADDVALERPDLQALAAFKYDEYQQYFTGMRFIESLAVWLNQFSNDAERSAAYNFVKKRLVFISDAEMNHLVSIAFPDFIRPVLIKRAASDLGISKHLVSNIVGSLEYQVLQRRSLFLGLSDGAYIGAFRRSNPQLSNEQIRQTYEISEERAHDMQQELANDLSKMLGRSPSVTENRFCTLFLLDDFSASGLSFLRNDGNGYKGKINKVLSSIYSGNSDFYDVFDGNNIHISVVLYSATTRAKEHLANELPKCVEQYGGDATSSIHVIQELSDQLRVGNENDEELIELLKAYFDNDIVDRHFQLGRCDRPYLGYDEGALPVILSHNTPNNSIPLLWFDKTRKYHGLFPRVSRHRR